jgi:hypothetical protein
MRRIGAVAALLAALLSPAAPSVHADTSAPPVGWVTFNTGIARPMNAAATTGFCNLDGCWYRADATHVEWDSQVFAYGYGSTHLGTGFAYIKWTLNGGNMRGNPVRFQVTSYTTHAYFEGEVRNGAPGVSGGGSLLTRGLSPTYGAKAANTWLYCNAPNGWGSYNIGVWDKNMTDYMYWNLSNYPGSWYVYARSVVAHATSSAKNNYFFDAVNQLPGSPDGAGWVG